MSDRLSDLRQRAKAARLGVTTRAKQYAQAAQKEAGKSPGRTIFTVLIAAAVVGFIIWGIVEWAKKDDKKKNGNKGVGAPTLTLAPGSSGATGGMSPTMGSVDAEMMPQEDCPGPACPPYCHSQPHVGPVTPKPMPGQDCASLGPDRAIKCKQDKLNRLVAGHCDDLQGCDRAVCESLFAQGVFPRSMRYA